MSQQEKSYEDYFEELYGDGPATEEKEDETPPEPEEQEKQVEVSTEQESDEPASSSDEGEESASAKKEEADAYEALLDKVDDPDLKKQIQQVIQSDRSQRGRVSALTKKLQKLEEYYNNAISQAPAREPARSVEAPASTAKKEDPKGRKQIEEELPPEVAALKEKAPAVYSAVVAMAEANTKKELETARQEYEERLKPLEESAKQEANKREADRLEKMASELFDTENTGVSVRDVISSSDFSAWLRGQPQNIRNIYKNARSADEAILILNKFENDYEYMRKINEQINTKQAPNERKNESPAPTKGDELKQKRDENKKKSVSPKSKSAATAAVDSTDYDKIFDHFWGESGVYRTKRQHV